MHVKFNPTEEYCESQAPTRGTSPTPISPSLVQTHTLQVLRPPSLTGATASSDERTADPPGGRGLVGGGNGGGRGGDDETTEQNSHHRRPPVSVLSERPLPLFEVKESGAGGLGRTRVRNDKRMYTMSGRKKAANNAGLYNIREGAAGGGGAHLGQGFCGFVRHSISNRFVTSHHMRSSFHFLSYN